MKIAIYAISLNESQFIERWYKSAKEADCIVLADTGSTDDTVIKAKELGVDVHEIKISPWRFDKARNASMDLIPDDVDLCVQLDIDEILTPGWRKRLEDAYIPGINRFRYEYIWSWISAGKPDLIYFGDKICARHSHRWVNAVHEVLRPHVPEYTVTLNGGPLIEHHADNTKSRGSYLPLLEIDTKEDPNNDRNAHYLGREYYYYQMYDKAIPELQRHLSLPSATWNAERAASMRYIAKSYKAMNNLDSAMSWHLRAIAEDITGKEPMIDLALTLLETGDWYGVISWCNRVLALPAINSYMNEKYTRNEGPYDLMAVAFSKLGNHTKALELAKIAFELCPSDERLKKNVELIENDLRKD